MRLLHLRGDFKYTENFIVLCTWQLRGIKLPSMFRWHLLPLLQFFCKVGGIFISWHVAISVSGELTPSFGTSFYNTVVFYSPALCYTRKIRERRPIAMANSNGQRSYKLRILNEIPWNLETVVEISSVFVYGLFYRVLNSSDCVALNDKMINE